MRSAVVRKKACVTHEPVLAVRGEPVAHSRALAAVAHSRAVRSSRGNRQRTSVTHNTDPQPHRLTFPQTHRFAAPQPRSPTALQPHSDATTHRPQQWPAARLQARTVGASAADPKQTPALARPHKYCTDNSTPDNPTLDNPTTRQPDSYEWDHQRRAALEHIYTRKWCIARLDGADGCTKTSFHTPHDTHYYPHGYMTT